MNEKNFLDFEGLKAYDQEIKNYIQKNGGSSENIVFERGSGENSVQTTDTNAEAIGDYSAAIGQGTIAAGTNQYAQGRYNVEDAENKYVHIVGNGTSDTARSNAHTIDWNGNAWFSGDITVGASKEKLATENVVDTKIAAIVESAPETLNTLNELAAALGDDPNFATTVATEIGKKVDTAIFEEKVQELETDKISHSEVSTVAKTGNYEDLTNIPTFFFDVDDDGTLFINSNILSNGDEVEY